MQVWWCCGLRLVEDRVEALAEELAAGLAAWRSAQIGLADAVRRRERAVARAERELAVALGGVSFTRWKRLVAGRSSLRDPAVGRAVFLARRNRPRVEDALAELQRVQAVEAAKVVAAEATLHEAVRRCSPWAPRPAPE